MAYDYDVISIGLGPAGMAVSAMAAEMGLSVLAVEKNKIGGECMNVGCIPSKALLRAAKARHLSRRAHEYALSHTSGAEPLEIFAKIQGSLHHIGETKNKKMFDKVELLLGEGGAEFVDAHTIKVGGRTYTGKRIFIAVGTKPALPPIPGLKDVPILTNENLFHLGSVPKSLTIIGGGAIGTEMAQAFSRLGSAVTLVQVAPFLVPAGDQEAGAWLEKSFAGEGIEVLNNRNILKVEEVDGLIELTTKEGDFVASEKLLVAAGRQAMLAPLKLDKAGVEWDKRGIKVNDYLETTQKHIYAVGDCNGHAMLSHAAMHQGMIAFMNSLVPWPLKRKFKSYVVPWTVFTEPQLSMVGAREDDLKAKGVPYTAIRVNYADYGAAIAEQVDDGFVKVLVGRWGRILGATVVGEGSGEMINEWALAVQKRLNIVDILFLQHSFPSMSFLNKRVAEIWMMKKFENPILQRLSKFVWGRARPMSPTTAVVPLLLEPTNGAPARPRALSKAEGECPLKSAAIDR